MRGRGIVRRRHGRMIDDLAGLRAQLGRIHETIAAHPDLVVRGRQIGDDIAALVVGHDDLDEVGRQVVGFCDHPDAGFRPFRSGHHAADIVGVDGDRLRRGRPHHDIERRTHHRQREGSSGRHAKKSEFYA